MPLGLLPEPPYVEGAWVLERGALVVMFSDGIVEAQGPDGALYGTARLRELVGRAGTGSAQELVRSVLDDLDAFRAETAQDDDVTLVVLGADSPAVDAMSVAS